MEITKEYLQKYIDKNNIQRPVEFKKLNMSLYQKMQSLHLCGEVIYPNRTTKSCNLKTLDDFQNYITKNKIESNNQFRKEYNSIYQRAGKFGYRYKLIFKKGHNWRHLDEFTDIEDFQKFVDENHILSPMDFKKIDGPIYRKLSKLGFTNKIRYDKRNFSLTEITVLKELTNNLIKYTIQERFDWLKSKKGFSLSLDFYLPECNIAIECQGRQHFEVNGYFGGEQRYQDEEERNKTKHQLCTEHGIEILYYSDILNQDFRNFDTRKFEDYLGYVYTDINELIGYIIKKRDENRTAKN